MLYGIYMYMYSTSQSDTATSSLLISILNELKHSHWVQVMSESVLRFIIKSLDMTPNCFIIIHYEYNRIAVFGIYPTSQ